MYQYNNAQRSSLSLFLRNIALLRSRRVVMCKQVEREGFAVALDFLAVNSTAIDPTISCLRLARRCSGTGTLLCICVVARGVALMALWRSVLSFRSLYSVDMGLVAVFFPRCCAQDVPEGKQGTGTALSKSWEVWKGKESIWGYERLSLDLVRWGEARSYDELRARSC